MHKTSFCLLGIPGNHDYYDSLDGFNRQFRRPQTASNNYRRSRAQLSIPTFNRRQMRVCGLALRSTGGSGAWDMKAEKLISASWNFSKGLPPPRKVDRRDACADDRVRKVARKDESQSKSFAALGLSGLS